MRTNKLYAAALILFFTAGLAVTLTAAEEGPCKADAEKFCKDVKQGEGRIMQCLKAHEAELSAGCKAKGLEAKKKIDGLKEACKGDKEKFCKNAGQGKHPFLKCLKEHEAELSETCKAKMAEERAELFKSHPCLAEMEKFCKDVKPGEGRVMACLKEHEAEFSAACKTAMAERKEDRKKERPCMADLEKFCKDAKPGEGGMKCLKAHEAELSEACKAKQAERKEKRGNKEGKRKEK